MARKVKPDPVKEVLQGSSLALTREEYMGLELHEARVHMQIALREKYELQLNLMSVEYQRKRDELRRKQVEAVASMEAAKREYTATVARIQNRLGINLGGYTVRDDGTLMLITDTGGQEPGDSHMDGGTQGV